MKIVCKSPEETEKFAKSFVESLVKEGKVSVGATIVALHGNLGAGKTAFVKGIAKALGVKEEITSPTFTLMKCFPLAPSDSSSTFSALRFTLLIHIDAYRLESGRELSVLGWHEIISNPKNLIFLEWPEKVADVLPKEMKKLSFTFIDEKTREIEY